MQNKWKNKPDKCNHYPILGLDADYRHGGCWKVIEYDFQRTVRQCQKCGMIDIGYNAGTNPDRYLSEGARWQLNKDRDDNAVNMIQPIDPKTGKFNEDFGKHYGYNPLKTPAPQVNNQNDSVDDMMSGEAEKNLKMNKL